MMTREEFIAAYIEAALFADTPEDARDAELSNGGRTALSFQAAKFFDANRSAVEMYSVSSHGSNAGHDFWYSRNGHGCGYWEHDSYASARHLDAAAKAAGSVDIYLGDDGELHVA